MRRHLVRRILACLLFAVTATTLVEPANAALPTGFSDSLVVDFRQPTALAFTPDGRMLIASQPGRLYVYENGALFPTPALDLSLANRICSNGERGLVGVAVDPNFSANGFIYVFYAFNQSGICPVYTRPSPDDPVSRLSRFTLLADNSIDLASERVLLDNIPLPKTHVAGDLHFGKDGFLYISSGDGLCDYLGDSGCAAVNDAARDNHVLLGKILRITRVGGIPPSNPFQGANSARCNRTGGTVPGKHCQETFATGLRNPFRIAFDPNASGTRFFINDVGQNRWEEIDLGKAGADYGWNVREGPCPNGVSSNCSATPPRFTAPIHFYNHSTGCEAITGGAFLPNGRWPAAYDGSYFFADYVCGKIFRLVQQAGGGYKSQGFATNLGVNSAVHMAFGPHVGSQALYYTSYANGGQVRRISFTGSANRVPNAVVSATPRSGPVPLAVKFDASGSNDPDGDALTYEWSFGDGSPPAFGRAVAHSYAAGTFHPSLTVTDARGAQAQASVRIDPGSIAPKVIVLSPSASTRFRVGQPLTLRARATDGIGNLLRNNALRWTVVLHHNAHTHPYLSAQRGNNIVITAPAPEDLPATRTSYLELQLVVTDTQGVQTTVVHNVLPKLVNVSFATVPAGLRLKVDGASVPTPHTVTSWWAYRIQVIAPDQSNAAGRPFVFRSWSDGGAGTHVITTPAAARTYTATFR